MKVFRLAPGWHVDEQHDPHAVKASLADVLSYVSASELSETFGGYVIWRAPVEPCADMPGEAIGVWGRRNIGRFIKLLSDRGALVEVVEDEGPRQSVKMMLT